jgi:hypothetical protein
MCNVALLFVFIAMCNIIRARRMGTLKRLYKTHRKIATLYKIHRVFVTRVGYSRGTWEPGSQEILGSQAKYLAGFMSFS